MHEAPGTLHRLKGQYRFFRFFLGRCRGSILFFQVGRFYEFYDRQAEIAQELLGLKETEPTRGFRTRCGFPVRLKEMYLRRLLRSDVSVYVIREQGRWLSGLKKRCIAERWIPLPLALNE